MLGAGADFAVQVFVLAFLGEAVGFKTIARGAEQWAEEFDFACLAAGVVAGVQRLVIADTGDAAVVEVESRVGLQAVAVPVTPDLAQGP